MKNFSVLFLAIIFLQGCATSLGQNIVNPNVDEDTWRAEQAYFVEQLETFCFDRRWDERPLSLSEDRPLHGGKTYSLWGSITDDMTGQFTGDFHYVCHLTANIPMYRAALDVNGYRIRRSSAWAYHNRRHAFHRFLVNRYGALDTKLSASMDHHKIPSGIGMLLRDGETQVNVQYFRNNSGVRVSIYRRQLFQGGESDLSNFPPGAKVVPWYEIRMTDQNSPQSGPSFIKVESPLTPIQLADILAFDHVSEEQIASLQSEREKLTDADKARLQTQTRYNLYRFVREMEYRQSTSNDLKQFAREQAAFERELAEKQAASNRAIFANVVGALQSSSTSSSYSPGSSTYSQTSGTASSTFNSGLVPWGDIQAEALKARQMKQDQFNRAQARQTTTYGTPASSASSRTPASNQQTSRPDTTTYESSSTGQYSSQANDDNSRAASASSSKSKVYEPMPESVQSTNDTWFGSQSDAVAYARLNAANKVTAICTKKGARIDTLSFPDIKAGIAPARWSYSSPDCHQGGVMGKEWKCEARVSGTCYRMQ